MSFLVFSFELLDSDSGMSRNKTQYNMNYLAWGDKAATSKVLPSTGLTQPALDGLIYTVLLTYYHLTLFPMTLSQQIKVPILLALHACG